jgi:hypothetical protein
VSDVAILALENVLEADKRCHGHAMLIRLKRWVMEGESSNESTSAYR